MAFSFTTTKVIPGGAGSMGISYGTYTNTAGDTGGTIIPGQFGADGAIFGGFSQIDVAMLTPVAAAVVATASVVRTTLPDRTNSFIIVTSADETGNWLAVGY